MSAPPGWYGDGVTPGVERWFDGTQWSDVTRPVVPHPVPAQPGGGPLSPAPPTADGYRGGWPGRSPAGGYPGGWPGPSPAGGYPGGWPGPGYAGPGYPTAAWQQPPPSQGPDSAMHWILPVGRSWQSVVAGYLGISAPFLWLLGPFAIATGIWALVRARRGGHGTGRAITGIVGGAVGTVLFVTVGIPLFLSG